MSSFRTSYPVTRRAPGSWDEGRWVPGATTSGTIMATVQPASASDYSMIAGTRGGRWPMTLLKVYTAQTLAIASKDEVPGDLITYNGEQYMFIREARRQTLASSQVAHNRYLILSLRELEDVDAPVG